MQHGANVRRDLVVALLAAAVFAGLAAPARAYDDKSTVSAAMELLGVNMDEKPTTLDYRERAKLVLPPNRSFLPVPGAAAADRPADWPTNAASQPLNRDRYARVRNAPAEEQKPGLMSRAFGGLTASISSGAPAQTAAVDTNVAEPPRRMLADPPAGYRTPTKDLSAVRDTDGKKSSSWWNPMSWGSDGSDAAPQQTASNSPVAGLRPPTVANATTSTDHAEPEGAISTIGKWLSR